MAAEIVARPLVGGEPQDGPADAVIDPADRRRQAGSVVVATTEHVDRALAGARDAQAGWDALGGAGRAVILEQAANLFERDMALLVGLCVREAGKTVANGVPTCARRWIFCATTPACARADFSGPGPLPGPTGERNEISLHGRGVFACISPWNFPVAIFTGQVAGALAAGNCAIAKPAEQTPLTAFAAVRLLHEAGVPGEVLHFLPGAGPEIGGALVRDPRVSGVVFTGSTEVAQLINRGLAAREGPVATLIAETGGLNAMIADSTALPEQLVRDVVDLRV